MPDFRVADTAPDHRKMRSAGLAAVGLWAMSGAWAMDELTDGWVPRYYVTSWPSGARLASTLCRVGLWRAERLDGIDGYRFHDWHDFQRAAEQIENERTKANVRRQMYATPELVTRVKRRDRDRCRFCGRAVSWTNRRGLTGATLTHVIPPAPHGGKNTIDNVIVACRECDAAKSDRTPAEAGMPLRPAPGSPDPDGSSARSRTGSSSEPEKNSPPPPPPHWGGFSSSTRGTDEPVESDGTNSLRGADLVRSELDAARARRAEREAGTA